MKTGIIDMGGGLLGIYACGVLDYCLEQNIRFDLGIGISACSANLASFIAGQRERNFIFYTEYGLRKQYASVGNFIRKLSFIDMDYVYGTLSNHDGENPLDYTALRDNPMEFIVVAARQSILISGTFGRTITMCLKRPRRFHLSASPISFRVCPNFTKAKIIIVLIGSKTYGKLLMVIKKDYDDT